MLLIGGRPPGWTGWGRPTASLRPPALAFWSETFPTRLTRGAGVPAADRLGYLAEQAAFQLDGIKRLIVAGTRAPVSFFAYPGKQSVPDSEERRCTRWPGWTPTWSARCNELAEVLAPGTSPRRPTPRRRNCRVGADSPELECR